MARQRSYPAIRFAESVSVVEDNALALHAMASGAAEERNFHRSRVSNALHHVVVETPTGRIYAPAKWCGAAHNSIDTYFANKDPVTDHFRRILRGVGFSQISPGDPNHKELYDGFVGYCSAHGFEHSKPTLEKRHYHVFGVDNESDYPDEIPNGGGYWEGAKIMVKVNRYERDRNARQECIRKKGTSCSACKMSFGETYGELGDGFIHVHHLKPLSEINEKYQVDPVNDLEPVCPNCHAMLHRGDEVMTIEELRKILAKNK